MYITPLSFYPESVFLSASVSSDSLIMSAGQELGATSDLSSDTDANTGKTSATFKALPIGTYTVTALSWSQTYDVKSVVVTTSTSERHDILEDYEFKFTASHVSEPKKHAEASVNNVWDK